MELPDKLKTDFIFRGVTFKEVFLEFLRNKSSALLMIACNNHRSTYR